MYSVKCALLALSCLLVVVSATWKSGGQSNSFRKQDDHGNYAFGYQIKDPYGATNSRKESGDAYGNKEGSYSLSDTDGRHRIVEYKADKTGFRAKIKSNEPGVISHEAADASYSANGGGHGGGHGGSYQYQSGGPQKW